MAKKRKKRQPEWRQDGSMLSGQRREAWIVVGPRNRHPTLFVSAVCSGSRDEEWFDETIEHIIFTMNMEAAKR